MAADASGAKATRVIALIGPFHSGKTTLLESILSVTGTLHRKATSTQRQFGDSSPEAQTREMGTELNVGSTDYLGDRYTFLDCPGSIELLQETLNILPVVDAAVIVTEPDDSRIQALAPLFRTLEDLGIPRFVMVNKIDRSNGSIRALVESFSKVSAAPVLLRHIPIRKGEEVVGYCDLASERCYVYHPGEASEVVPLPEDIAPSFADARFKMLETLADFDDHLMEELLEDIAPPKDEVFTDLTKDLREGLIVPVFMGAALHDEGTRRLMKALRHEVPNFSETLKRVGVAGPNSGAVGQVIRSMHTQHGGKVSVTRIFSGEIREGDQLNDERVSGVYQIVSQVPEKTDKGHAGDIVGLGKLEHVATGDTVSSAGDQHLAKPQRLDPVYALALSVENRSDEMKLSEALKKLTDEDPALMSQHREETGELIILGQGEMHLLITADRLKSRFGISVKTSKPLVPYRETIRKAKTQHSRYKKQSGGHGQFGDIVVDIKPLPPGTGFVFEEKIHGGSVPKQYIPSVEVGVRDYLKRGPLGFPVVDVGVTLTDGKYHAVDSSDMAFQTAGRLAMSEALPDCNPVLLEPILHIKIHVPSEFTARVNSVISSRRGQILGFDARQGWPGWDTVEAQMPQAETQDLIIELRSLTLGAGTYEARFDHLSEISGRIADQVVNERREDRHA